MGRREDTEGIEAGKKGLGRVKGSTGAVAVLCLDCGSHIPFGREFSQLRMYWNWRGSAHSNIRHQALTTVVANVCCPNKMP